MTTAKASLGHKSQPSGAKSGAIAENGDSRPKGTACSKNDSNLPFPEDLVLWKSPIQTSVYFVFELVHQLQRGISWLGSQIKTVLLTGFIIALIYCLRDIEGAHQGIFQLAEKKLLWCFYWIGLGILSSVGLGTGLHTFLLYLGPHIAAVTVAAHECKSLNFPEPPYPDEIICPDDGSAMDITLGSIMGKVRLEAFMWGFGTAIGELPPYFMARTARLSGQKLEDIIEEDPNSYWTSTIKKVVEKAGFLGILICASIPNPLFDLAGITCGHFLVPFWTFFGATVIGKAVVKMLLQEVFVIIAFSEHHFESLIDLASSIPHVGENLSSWTQGFLTEQKASLHRKSGVAHIPKEPHLFAKLFEGLVFMMLLYFVVSIIQSFAQNCVRRLSEKGRKTHHK